MGWLLGFGIILIVILLVEKHKKKNQKEAQPEKQQENDYTLDDIKVEVTLEKPATKKTPETSVDHMQYIKARTLSEDYTVIDFETTGLDHVSSKIIQIAAVKYKNHTIADEFHSYVNPEQKIASRITRIIGITNDKVKDAPVIEEILPQLLFFIGNETIVAHNAPFDMKFLLHNIHQCGHPYVKYRVIDTLPLARRNINTENHKLETLKGFLRLNQHESHNALSDCYVAGELYKYCFEKANRKIAQ